MGKNMCDKHIITVDILFFLNIAIDITSAKKKS